MHGGSSEWGEWMLTGRRGESEWGSSKSRNVKSLQLLSLLACLNFTCSLLASLLPLNQFLLPWPSFALIHLSFKMTALLASCLSFYVPVFRSIQLYSALLYTVTSLWEYCGLSLSSEQRWILPQALFTWLSFLFYPLSNHCNQCTVHTADTVTAGHTLLLAQLLGHTAFFLSLLSFDLMKQSDSLAINREATFFIYSFTHLLIYTTLLLLKNIPLPLKTPYYHS